MNWMEKVSQNEGYCNQSQQELIQSANGSLAEFQSLLGDRCFPNFDGSVCFPATNASSSASQSCPFMFCSHCALTMQSRTVNRVCHDNRTWGDSNYNNCLIIMKHHQECFESYCNKCDPDPKHDMVVYTSLSFSFASLILLLIALIVFNAYKSIQCRRLSIHKHMAGAFIMRVVAFIVWTLAQQSHVFINCEKQKHRMEIEWVCKALLFSVIYFQCASIFWMSVEGCYLITRFTVLAMRQSEGPFYLYCLVGWGLPIIPVALWAVLHSLEATDGYCWVPYTDSPYLWILTVALGSALALNMIFLCSIMVILVRKLTAENGAESRKIWRTIKATLLLVPLLGISNVPLFYEPEDASQAYHVISAVLQYSQGIFIALLYCFFNAEIQNALKRSVQTSNTFQTVCPRFSARNNGDENVAGQMRNITNALVDATVRIAHMKHPRNRQSTTAENIRKHTKAASGSHRKRTAAAMDPLNEESLPLAQRPTNSTLSTQARGSDPKTQNGTNFHDEQEPTTILMDNKGTVNNVESNTIMGENQQFDLVVHHRD